ncbi:uncharacterized protein LOC111361920 [Spodoptera litura]|uniref:Uncharacterized protein LOC111361920 n=1 Tax=Spodoptera litura TaxID=69820 RepID=A0A9J7J208_SPOLT|nr:uncharacterized protein LOC111361920 [Spodoptera litura]
MEELKNMLISMQQDIKQQKQDMLEMKKDIKDTIINSLSEKFKNLELKNEFLEKKTEEQSNKINNLERQCRRKNLILFGVEEIEKSYEELEKLVINIINTYIKISCDTYNIEAVRRLGKKGVKVRPISITFNTLGFKIKIQKNKHNLKNTSYYLKEDYPIEVLVKRKELQVQLQKEKDAGNTAFIKYDKIIILNNKQPQQKQSSKRYHSESPETLYPDNLNAQHTSKNTAKKNKGIMTNYIIQKPKLILAQTEPIQRQSMTPDQNTT